MRVILKALLTVLALIVCATIGLLGFFGFETFKIKKRGQDFCAQVEIGQTLDQTFALAKSAGMDRALLSNLQGVPVKAYKVADLPQSASAGGLSDGQVDFSSSGLSFYHYFCSITFKSYRATGKNVHELD